MAKMNQTGFAMVLALCCAVLLCVPAVAFAGELTTGKNLPLVAQAGTGLSNAQTIPLNAATRGTLADDGAEDWYKVTLPSAGKFQVTFGGDYSTNTDKWSITLKDSANTEIWSHLHRASEMVSETFGTTGLPAGTYYLVVANDWYNDVSGIGYSITPKFQASTAWETELNDGLQAADAIPLDAAVNATMRKYGDDDWFRMTLPQAGRLQVMFGAEYKDVDDQWVITLKDANNTEIWKRRHAANELTVETLCTTGLPAGTYYLVVSCDSYDEDVVDLAYNMTPMFQASAAWETEFNDGLQAADAISLGNAAYGTMRNSDDVDWYKISLPKAGKFQVAFGADYKNTDYDWIVSLRDANNKVVWERRHSANKVTSETFGTTGLPAGTYYLVVSSFMYDDALVGVAYNMTPQFQASTAWETEFNDLVTTADIARMGKAIYGAMRDDDEDWFKVSIPVKGRFQIGFKGTYADDSGGWSISLRNSRNDEVEYFNYPVSNKTAKSFITKGKLNPGVYYIMVNAGPSDLTYKLTPGYYVPKTGIAKLINAKKAFKVKWKKRSGATQYQIRYAVKASMKDAKTVNVSAKSSAKTVRKLKGNKRYYVQVRVVKMIDGVKYYSAWSGKSSVKTKK